MASGGTFKEISKTNFEKLKIPLPPLEKQQEIVDEIEQYQKVIESNEELISTLTTKIEKKISSIYK